MSAKLRSVILMLLLTIVSTSCSKRGSSNYDVASSTYGLKLEIIDGHNQKTIPGRLFTKPLTVRATNVLGEPVPDLNVVFSLVSGSGFYLTPSSVKTGPSGIAAIEVKGPDAYNVTGKVKAQIDGTPLSQIFEIATNDTVPGVHFEIESTLGQTIKAGKEFGFIVKLVNADGTLTDYTGPMTTIWNMNSANSWTGEPPKNLLTTYQCSFVAGICHTPSSGPQAIVLHDSRAPTTVFMGDGNSGYMDVFAYDITVVSDVPSKVVVADDKGGPNSGAKVVADKVLNADSPPLNFAAAITDASGNYLGDAGSVTWSSDRVELSSYFSSTLGELITFTPTKTIAAGNFGYIYAQHPSYPLARSGKIYIDPGQLHRFEIEKVGGGNHITAGEPFKILIRAVDSKGNSVGQNSAGSGFHGTRQIKLNATNYQSGSIPTGGSTPWFGLASSLITDDHGHLVPIAARLPIIAENAYMTFFNLGEATALANDYRLIFFDATSVSPTLTVSTDAVSPFPAISGSVTFNISPGPAHHVMLRRGAGPEGQSVCQIPNGGGGLAMTNLQNLVLEPFGSLKSGSCNQNNGIFDFQAGQTTSDIYYAIEDIAGNWIANVSGSYSTTANISSTSSNFFRNSFAPAAGLSPSLTFNGTKSGIGLLEIIADYTLPNGTLETFRSYIAGSISPSAFHHFEIELNQSGQGSYNVVPAPYNIFTDRSFTIELHPYDAFNNLLVGNMAADASGQVLMTVTPTGPLLNAPNGTENIDLPSTGIVNLQVSSPGSHIYQKSMWIPNIATGAVTFSFTNATNGAPNRTITVTPIAGPLGTIDLRTASGTGGTSLVGQPLTLSTDDDLTLYLSGFDSLGNLSSMPVGTWSVPNLSPSDALMYSGAGSTSLFQPQKPGSADKIIVSYNKDGTILTAETGPITLTTGQFKSIAIEIPPGIKTAGEEFNAIIKLRDQRGNNLNINGMQYLTLNVIGSTPTLLNYSPKVPANGYYNFTNGETTLPFTFYNSTDTNPRIQISASLNTGEFGSGISGAGEIVVTNSELNHLHVLSSNTSISAGDSNRFTIYAEDLWGNQIKTGTGSSMQVQINLTNLALTSQDITATTLIAPSSVAGLNDTQVQGTLTDGAATFDVTSTTAGPMTVAASVLSSEVLPGTNTMDTLTVLPLSQITGIRWAPSQEPLSQHSASPTSPIISSSGSLAAQILDQYQNVITTNNSETINISLVGATRPFYAGTTTKTVTGGTATFGDLKYTKTEPITLRASVGSNPTLFVDSPVTVIPNGSRQTLILMPNQSLDEGSGSEATAILNSPFADGTEVSAGTTFPIKVRLVDIAFNTVLETGAQISLVATNGGTDPNITVTPATNTITNGEASFNVTIKRQGTHRLAATPVSPYIGKLLGTPYTVTPLSTQKLVILLPGQALNEGAPDLASAITNPSPTQKAGVSFSAKVVATDIYYNKTMAEPGTSVSITSSDPNDVEPSAQNLASGETTFTVTNVTASTSQSLTVTGNYSGSSSTLYAINPGNATQCILSYGAPQSYNPGKTPYTAALTGLPSNKTAGTNFTVTALAVDNYFNTDTAYSGPVQITTPNDPSDTEPAASTFSAGSRVFTISPVSVGTNKAIDLSCTGLTALTPATHTINVGAKTYLVSYFPDFQSFDDTRGHQSLATALSAQSSANRDAGMPYTVNVVATDSRYNIVNDNTTVTLTSSDANFATDAAKALVAGRTNFTLRNYRAGSGYTVGASGTGYTKVNSTAYNVLSGSPTKLLVVLPGENYSPGRAIASEAAAQAPYRQTVAYDYQVKVYATDDYFNPITSENSAMVSLSPSAGSFNYVGDSTIQMSGGLATFTVNHSAALPTLVITPSAAGYSGEPSESYQVLAALTTPSLALKDGTTDSANYVRQTLTQSAITEGATVNAWCLSETQSTRPVSAGTSNNKALCNGTSGAGRDALGWYTSRPTNINLNATNGAKTVNLWVADTANNVSVTPVSASINLDTVLPGTPSLSFPSGTHTNTSTPALTITGDTDAVKYCLIEQAAVTAAPTPPLYNDGCWSETKPTNVTMKALGSRTVYLFTKDIAENVSLPTSGYSQTVYYDPDAPGAFAVTGIKGNLDTAVDDHLGTTLTPTVVWSTASDATTVTYSIVIKQAGTAVPGCSDSIAGATQRNLAGCTLTDGGNYTVEITATDQAGNSTNAAAFAFDVDNTPPTAFAINGATGGTDLTPDGLLSNGNIVTTNWNDSSGETYYKMLVYRSDQTTVQCSLTTATANVTSHTFTGCALNYANVYYLRVEAWDDAGNMTPATNANYAFTVVPQASHYLVTLTYPGDQTAGVSIDLTITAKLGNGNTDTSFTGTQIVNFTTDGASGDNSICNQGANITFEAPTTASFSNGTASVTGLKLKKAESGRTITAASTIGGVDLTGTTPPFNVTPNVESCKRFLDSNSPNGNVLSGTTIPLNLGETKTVYSIGYDTYGNFIGESSLTWSGTLALHSVPYPRVGSSTTVIGLESGNGVLQGSGTSAQVTFSVTGGSTTWTSASTDINGRNYLGSSNILKSYFYDASADTRKVSAIVWRQGATTMSWYTEGFSAVRGSRDEFPAKTFLIATDQGLDIIDATNNQLWMRFVAGSNRAINSDLGTISDVTALEGKIYVAMANTSGVGGLIIIDFATDEVFQLSNTARKSTQNILNRNTAGTLNVNATYPGLGTNEKVLSLSAAKISTNEYLAMGTATRALLLKTNATTSLYASSATTGQPITAIRLTSNSKLYFAESGVKLYRANLTLPLSANFGSSYAYDRTTTNAKLANLQVTSLSIAEKVFSSNTHHQLMIGSASGLTVINENSTDTSATSVNFNYQGSGDINPSVTSPFGAGFVQSLGTASSYLEAPHSSGLVGTGTIDFWFRPEQELNFSSDIMSLLSKGTTNIDGSFGIKINAGGQGKLELWVRHGGVTHYVESSTTLWNKGQWYHIAGVFKPTGLDLYVNGQREAQNAVDLTGFSANTSVLRLAGDGTNGFNGAMDEVRISKIDRYNGALSFALSTSPYSTDATNNVYLYHLDHTTGLVATATNGTNGALIGNTWFSKPLYKGSDTAINQIAADAVSSTSMAEIITNSAWSELTALHGASPTVNAFDTNLPGTGVFYYHDDGLLIKDIGIIKINGGDKELHLNVR